MGVGGARHSSQERMPERNMGGWFWWVVGPRSMRDEGVISAFDVGGGFGSFVHVVEDVV